MTMSWGEEELVYTEDFTFTANSVTNDTVDVTDTMTGRTPEVKDLLGTATVAESPKTFTYSEELAAVAGQMHHLRQHGHRRSDGIRGHRVRGCLRRSRP